MPSLFDSFSAFQREGGSWNELPFQSGFHTLGRSQFRDPFFLFGPCSPRLLLSDVAVWVKDYVTSGSLLSQTGTKPDHGSGAKPILNARLRHPRTRS